MAIDVASLHRDRFANFVLCQNIGVVDGTTNGAAVSLPLVTNAAQSVQVRQSIGCSQCLAAQRFTTDGHSAGAQVIDIEHGRTGAAVHQFSRTMAVGVIHADRNAFAHQGFTQRQSAASGPTDGTAVGLPLVTEIAQTIAVGQGAGIGAQGLPLFGRAAQRHSAGRHMAEANLAAIGIKLIRRENPIKQNGEVGTWCGVRPQRQRGHAAARG